MRKLLSLLVFIMTVSALLFSCKTGTADNTEKAKKEIAQAEKDFEKMAADKGIAEAFWFFADSTATIKGNNDSLIHGKEGIRNLFSADRFKKAKVKSEMAII